jgi:hypothetical protein
MQIVANSIIEDVFRVKFKYDRCDIQLVNELVVKYLTINAVPACMLI